VSRGGYFFHRPIIDELLSPVIGEALRFRSPLAACSASMSSCLRSASRLALAAESFAAAALSAHLLASCRRCSERVLILQVADYFAATALPGVWGGRAAHSPRTQTTPGCRVGCSYLLSRACCDASARTRMGRWSHARPARSDGHRHGGTGLHAPQKLAVGRCWFQCHRIRTQHERPRRHCARERTERDRTIEGTLVAM
jgi:hypothetical protein